MSNTRHASEGAAFRQERFSSSKEFERGLMANLTARRCSVLERAEDRELIWFIQLLSHQPGGIKKLAADLLAQFPDRNATQSMRKFGVKAGQVYNAKQVRLIRDEMPDGRFPLKGEIDFGCQGLEVFLDEPSERREQRQCEANCFPSKYSAADFVGHCREAAAGLEKHLMSLCLDPGMPVADSAPWYFPTLISTLREVQAAWIGDRRPAAVTSIGKKIFSALDYAMATRRLVVIDGLPRTGKTHAAQAWCNLHPGHARYLECPATNDDVSFFRAIARSLGVSINLNSKAQELRNRIEEVLQGGDLALVIDEAHYLWPQRYYRQTTPARVIWVMSLVNHGIAVSLITAPQFFRSQKAIEKTSCWTSDQFVGRIGHYEKLPDALSPDDLKSVASVMLPGVSADSVKALTLYAESSGKYLGGMDAIAARARFICQADRRQRVEFRDVKRAIQESVTPSDEALKAAIGSENFPVKRTVTRTFARPLQTADRPAEMTLPRQREVRPARTELEAQHV